MGIKQKRKRGNILELSARKSMNGIEMSVKEDKEREGIATYKQNKHKYYNWYLH